jgi:hypothetical protein
MGYSISLSKIRVGCIGICADGLDLCAGGEILYLLAIANTNANGLFYPDPIAYDCSY